MRFLCRFGWHDWSPWGPVKETVIQSSMAEMIATCAKYGRSLSMEVAPGTVWRETVHRQHRVCLSCEAAGVREVFCE